MSLAGVDSETAKTLLLQGCRGYAAEGCRDAGQKVGCNCSWRPAPGECDFSITSSESRLEPPGFRFVRQRIGYRLFVMKIKQTINKQRTIQYTAHRQ